MAYHVFKKLVSSVSSVILIASLSGCDAQSVKPIAADEISKIDPVPQEIQGAATDVKSAPDTLQQKVDPIPSLADKPSIVSKEDVKVGTEPACVFTIRYPKSIDHEVTWRKEACSAVTARFIPVAELEKAGQLKDLATEALGDIQRAKATGVFYVESTFTASVFPLNVAGVPVEVSIAD